MRYRSVIVFPLLTLIATAAPSLSQTVPGPSRLDVGLYAGGSWSSAWLEAGGQSFGIGTNLSVGGFTHWWIAPRVGARLHVGYTPSDLPTPEERGALEIESYTLHNWFYDLSLAVRPFAGVGRPQGLSSFYFFVGGGGFTPNVGSDGDGDPCVPPYDYGDACLPYSASDATVGQVTAGLGATLIPLGPRVGAFVEGGVHGYSSPFRMGQGWTGQPPCPNPDCHADRRSGATVRLVGGVQLAFGPSPAPPVVPPPPPPPPPAPPQEIPMVLCVVANGFPRYAEVIIRPTVGDTIFVTEQGVRRPLRSAFPSAPTTASGLMWYEREEPIFLEGREYVRFGVPREVTAEEVRRIGDFRGVPLYATESDRTEGMPSNIFVPIQDGCIFQPFQMRERLRVRG